jgi:predicted DNA-binding transcriptional regulator AlpA
MSDEIRFISRKAAHRLTNVSPSDQCRKPDFPRPIKMGKGFTGRVSLVLSEIQEWQAIQIAKRNAANLDAYLQRIKPFAAHNVKER